MKYERLTLVLAAALAAAACQSDTAAPSEPQPQGTARVTVSPETTVVARGATVSLTARVLDAAGNTINDRSVDWLTYDASVATVQNGVVTGVAAGSATITATVDGKRGSARVTVTAPPATGLQITSISPNPLVEGQAAIINGSNFGFVPSNLRVSIDGVTATVTGTNGTVIQVVVPQTGCKPARNVDVQVRLLTTYSNVVSHPLRPASYANIATGQQVIIRDPSNFCLQFGASGAAEAYLIGVQSTEEQVTSLTPVSLSAVVPSGGGAGGPMLSDPLESARARVATAWRNPSVQMPDLRWQRARRAEMKAHELDRQLFQARLQPAVVASAIPTIPVSPRIGEQLTVRVPAFVDQCNRYATTTAVVRAITPRAVWLEDPANPSGGYDLQALSSLFESAVYDTDVDHFGAVSDIDRNGRVAIVVTKEVNRLAAQFDSLFALGGMVKAANFFATSVCPSSNESEIIYLAAPDPTGRFGLPNGTAAESLPSMKVLLAHEFVHLIQFAHAVPGNSGGVRIQPNWLFEAQATMAEELVGHRVTGRTTGGNYGGAIAYNRDAPDSPSWYRAVSWLGYYFGYLNANQRVANAPEQCSYLGLSAEGNNGPCASNDIIAYAVSWSLLRWMADQFGPTMAGGEKAFHKALVDNRTTGFAALASIVGVPIDSLLAQWAAALYVDDRIANAAPQLGFTSWNLFDVEQQRRETAHLKPRERAFSTFNDAVSVRGGSTAYFRVSGAGRPATAIRATTAAGAALPASMRMWVVRLQ